MEPITQKLIHSFGALADLGEEVASTGDFNEMVRTSLHLLLGTLAIRRGAVIEYLPAQEDTNCLAIWGADENYQPQFSINESDKDALLNSEPTLRIDEVQSPKSKVQSPDGGISTGSVSDRVNLGNREDKTQ